MRTDEDLIRAAFAAYFRTGGYDQPANSSDVHEHGDRSYVVLENGRGVLAVYRVLNSGQLKRLRRWPAALTEVAA